MSSPFQNKSAAQVEQKLDRWLAPLRDSEVWLEDEMSESHAAAQTRRATRIHKLSELVRQVPEEKAKLRRRSQWVWAVSAAAALMVAVMGTMLAQSQVFSPAQTVAAGDNAHLRQFYGQVVARREQGTTEILQVGAALHSGDEISTTAESYASLDISHARVDMASATTLELLRTDRRDQSYKLRAGRVDVSIPQVPGEPQSFAVQTPSATVRVRGTVFSVEVDDERGVSLTRVQVTRGSVSVEHEGNLLILGAGDRWSSRPEAPPSTAQEPEVQVERRVGTAPKTPASSLADQNQLFAKALVAQRDNNHALAAHLYGQLLKRYPGSPLGTTARAELAEAKRQLSIKKTQGEGTAK